MDTIKLLLVDDNEVSSKTVMAFFKKKGEYQVQLAKNGKEGVEFHKSFAPDVIVAEINLPVITGLEMADIIRVFDKNTPVLIVSKKPSENIKLEAMSHEIDNFIPKPFSPTILDGYIKISLRCHKGDNQMAAKEKTFLPLGAFLFDFENQQLKFLKKAISITTLEAKILMMLYKGKGQIVKRANILQTLWPVVDKYSSRCLDVHISKLRQYLLYDKSVKIVTIPREGLRLEC